MIQQELFSLLGVGQDIFILHVTVQDFFYHITLFSFLYTTFRMVVDCLTEYETISCKQGDITQKKYSVKGVLN